MNTETLSTYVVEETTNYKQFKFMKGNRNVNPFNLKRITKSMQTQNLFSPILVNENFEIIDGQHRFLARKELKAPIHYIVVPGYGVNEVHVLNTNATNWTRIDYLQGYVDMGLRPYIQFKEFMEQFPSFGIKAAMAIVSATKDRKNLVEINKAKSFEQGNLLIPDIAKAREYAKKITDYEKFYEWASSVVFVKAVLSLVKNPNYNHDDMMVRLSRKPNQITAQVNATNHVMQLEDIYNYHRRQKVSLRY